MPLRPEQIGLWPADWDYGVSLIRGIKRMARNSAPKPAWILAFVLKVKNMQPNVTFDTHKAVKALKSSGFNEKQAETVVETIDKAVNETVATKTDLEAMATKEDLALLADKMATKDDLEKMVTKKELRAELSSLETRMMRMMLLQTLVLVGTLGTLIVAVAKLL